MNEIYFRGTNFREFLAKKNRKNKCLAQINIMVLQYTFLSYNLP